MLARRHSRSVVRFVGPGRRRGVRQLRADWTERPTPSAIAHRVRATGRSGSSVRPLSIPLVVRVTSTNGTPVKGATVTFAVTAGSATVTPEHRDDRPPAKRRLRSRSALRRAGHDHRDRLRNDLTDHVRRDGRRVDDHRGMSRPGPPTIACGAASAPWRDRDGYLPWRRRDGRRIRARRVPREPRQLGGRTCRCTAQGRDGGLSTASLAPAFDDDTHLGGSSRTVEHRAGGVRRDACVNRRGASSRPNDPGGAGVVSSAARRLRGDSGESGDRIAGDAERQRRSECVRQPNQRHGARRGGLLEQAIVVADTANPAGGFTDAEYLSFATTFDTLDRSARHSELRAADRHRQERQDRHLLHEGSEQADAAREPAA